MVIKAQFYITRITRLAEQTASICSVYFEMPPDYPPFQPGHVVQVKPSQELSDLPLGVKSYCICSLPEDEQIELCIDLVNTYGMSGQLSRASEGTPIQMTVPSGKFLLPASLDKPVVFIGLGSGVGVMRGMLRQLLKRKTHQSIQFYAVNTDETAIPFEADLETLSEKQSNLQVYPILQTNGYDTIEVGDRILSHVDHQRFTEVYMAGPQDPLLELKDQLLHLGFGAKQFHVEGYV